MTNRARAVIFFISLIALGSQFFGLHNANVAYAGNSLFKGGSKAFLKPSKSSFSKTFKLYGKHGFSPPAPSPPLPPPRYVNVKAFGATGNGSTDDQVAIVNAVASAQSQGFPVYFPAGTYKHSGTIVSSTAFFGDGYSSNLVESGGVTYSVIMQGDHSGITNMVVYGAVQVNATNFLFDHVNVLNSPTNGIEVAKSSGGTISYVQCTNNANSGLYIWDSNNVYIHDNSFSGNGQYALRSDMQSNANVAISFYSNTIQGDVWLHGVQWFTFNTSNVVGRVDIQAVAAPPGMQDGVEIESNTIDGQSFGSQSSVPGVTMSGTPFAGFLLQQNSIANFQYCVLVSNVSRATLVSNTITNSTIDLITVSGYQGTIGISGNTLQGAGRSAVHVDANGGSIAMFNDQISNCCVSFPGSIIDIVYQGGDNYASLNNNVYTGAANMAQYFISCTIPGSATSSTIMGNSGGVLPNYLAP